ncbi:MAG: hypothetical protein AAGM38_08310 [Pseudomonadota bacterium]
MICRAAKAAAVLFVSAPPPSPGAAAETCGAHLSAVCVERLGAGALAAGAVGQDALKEDERNDDEACRRQLSAYRACIAALAARAVAAPSEPKPVCSEARAARLWEDAKAAHDCIGYRSYRAACPATPEAHFAASAMARLDCTAPGPSSGGSSAGW